MGGRFDRGDLRGACVEGRDLAEGRGRDPATKDRATAFVGFPKGIRSSTIVDQIRPLHSGGGVIVLGQGFQHCAQKSGLLACGMGKRP